jgi:predicted Zn-dependent protease
MYVGRPVTPEERVESFRKLVEQRPDEPFAWYSLAMSLRAAGRLDESARELADLTRRSPDYVPAYLMLGQVLERLDRAAEAADAYGRGMAAAARAGNEHARGELEQALIVLREGAR